MMKFATRNAVEFPASVLFWLIALCLSLSMPPGFPDVLIVAGCQIIAFFCALNAALDFPRFKMVVRVMLLFWFALMTFWTPLVLWNVGSIKEFGSK